MSLETVASISTLLLPLLGQRRITKEMTIFCYFVGMVALTMAHDMEDGRHLRFGVQADLCGNAGCAVLPLLDVLAVVEVPRGLLRAPKVASARLYVVIITLSTTCWRLSSTLYVVIKKVFVVIVQLWWVGRRKQAFGYLHLGSRNQVDVYWHLDSSGS